MFIINANNNSENIPYNCVLQYFMYGKQPVSIFIELRYKQHSTDVNKHIKFKTDKKKSFKCVFM